MIDNVMVNFMKLHEDAVVPTYAKEGDSGADLRSIETVTLKPGEFKLISTGIAVQMLTPFIEAQVRSRSGLAAKEGIWVLNSPGTVDNQYTGEIKVILANFSSTAKEITVGDRIAQLVFTNVCKANFVETATFNTTARGTSGFGSTGTN